MSFPVMSSAQLQSTVGSGQDQPLVLREGQMVHGQIKQLFPGQMAEIQIGKQTMVAKLEVPMKAGDSYYFQVNSVKPELQLKVIAGPTSMGEGQTRQLNSLMEAMQLPKTTEMTQLLAFVMKNKIPITREGLLQAEALLKSVLPADRAEALLAIQKIAELKLPFTESIMRSLIGVQTKESLHANLASFRGALTADPTVTAQTREAIVASLDKVAKPFAEATGNVLLGRALITLLDRSAPPDLRFATVQLLKNAGVLPERASLANLQQTFTSLLVNESTVPSQSSATPAGVRSSQAMQDVAMMLRQISSGPTTSITAQLEGIKAFVSAEVGLSSANKAMLTAIVDQAAARPSSETTTRFVQEFSQALLRNSAESAIASPFQSLAQGGALKEPLLTLFGQQDSSAKLATLVQNAERSESPAIQKLLQSAEGAIANAVEGKAVKDAIQTVVRSLGFNYEAALLGKGQDIGRLAHSLKPQLLALMQDPTVSQVVRDSAEAVVTRMNGPLLMSGENGVQHQLVMQVPLEFFGKRIDATLQWNGRMKDDGKIDPDFARILFYLDLQSLKKTVVDMQVQNRVVSVTIFNANEGIKMIGAQMHTSLKNGLENSGYTLSGVFFKNFKDDQKDIQDEKEEVQISKQGVDFRI